MEIKTINELTPQAYPETFSKKMFTRGNKEYDLELEKVVSEIKSLPKKESLVLLQFPDGLKPYATVVVDFLEEKCKKAGFLIWLGDCFGACDIPVGLENLKIDLVVQFGHNELMPKY